MLCSKNKTLRLLTCTAALIVCAGQAFAAKNVILMVGDGMGLQQVKAGSYYLSGAAGNLCFEQYSKGTVTTRSLNSSVTDSAAAATALATGYKVNNGAISQSSTGTAYQTILERAKASGKKTGLVTTVTITHATPAGFGAHEADRNSYINIGNDYLTSTRPEVIFGGGDPARGGSGSFSAAQVTTAQSLGYQVAYNKTQLAALNPTTTTRALGLFSGGYNSYEYDRTASSTEPHLTEMSTKALQLLEGDPDGFFLMIEGGKIDEACHAGDINRATREVVEFNNSVQAVLNWMQGRNDTMLIVTADHETNGLTATNKGKGSYATATWSGGGGHTGVNVPIYVTGANTNLVNNYLVGGVMDNTDVYKLMKSAYDTPVPEPGSMLALASGLFGLAGFAIRRRK